MEVRKIIFLSKWVICRFHVNLPECKLLFPGELVGLKDDLQDMISSRKLCSESERL